MDSASKSSEYTKFFNALKENDVTLITIDLVEYEFLIGASSGIAYDSKNTHIQSIIDSVMPCNNITHQRTYELIKEYGLDGKGVRNTDLLLGALLKQYEGSMYLMSRDTSDFIQRIFSVPFIINAPHGKGIFTYGIYKYH
jgi:hypothetical protein